MTLFVHERRRIEGHNLDITLPDGVDQCDWGTELECSADGFITGLTFAWGAFGLLYCGLYASYLWRAFRSLKGKLYQKYRLSHIILQLQVRCGTFCRKLLCVPKVPAVAHHPAAPGAPRNVLPEASGIFNPGSTVLPNSPPQPEHPSETATTTTALGRVQIRINLAVLHICLCPSTHQRLL